MLLQGAGLNSIPALSARCYERTSPPWGEELCVYLLQIITEQGVVEKEAFLKSQTQMGSNASFTMYKAEWCWRIYLTFLNLAVLHSQGYYYKD